MGTGGLWPSPSAALLLKRSHTDLPSYSSCQDSCILIASWDAANGKNPHLQWRPSFCHSKDKLHKLESAAAWWTPHLMWCKGPLLPPPPRLALLLKADPQVLLTDLLSCATSWDLPPLCRRKLLPSALLEGRTKGSQVINLAHGFTGCEQKNWRECQVSYLLGKTNRPCILSPKSPETLQLLN